MENKKLLSILIPTYNRADCLDNCLNSIFSQIDKEISKKIEIIVSNNASTDSTKEVMEKYKKYGNIDYKYSSNKKNLGPDGNFYKLIQEASSEFCWILGDNEYLERESLKEILKILEKNRDINLIWLNNSDKNEIKKISSKEELISNVSFYITFISGIIWKKNYKLKLDYSEVENTYLTQVFYYLDAIQLGEKYIIAYNKYFSFIELGNGGYKLFDIFSNNFNKILMRYNLDSKIIDKINKDLCLKFFPFWILNSKKTNKKTSFKAENIYETLKKYQSKYLYFWVVDYPIIKFNYFIGKIYYFFIRILLKIGRILNGR